MTGNSAITAAINVFDKGLGLTGEAWLETEDHTCIWNGSIKPENKEADSYLPFLKEKLRELGYDPGSLTMITLFWLDEGIFGWVR